MSLKKHPPLIGAHMSIAGGLSLAYERAESIGCTALQIFTKSNRQWNAPQISSSAAQDFKAAQEKSSVRATIAHATYLINIGAADQSTHTKSLEALRTELARCEQLNIPYLVLHPGSYTTSNETVCLNKISDALNTVFDTTGSGPAILLELMAGQGSSTCYTFEQLGYIISQSDDKSRLGVCFDTCHAFAAGYDFRSDSQYQAMWKEFDEIIGLKKLKAVHVNDSKKELGSRVDRHEDIGKGKLGLAAFELLFNDPRLYDIPKILETPRATIEDYARNLQVIKQLLHNTGEF